MGNNKEQTKFTKKTIDGSVLQLLLESKLFAKCPKCSKYMSFFEVYNHNCSFCGKINFEEIILSSLDS